MANVESWRIGEKSTTEVRKSKRNKKKLIGTVNVPVCEARRIDEMASGKGLRSKRGVMKKISWRIREKRVNGGRKSEGKKEGGKWNLNK